MVLSFGLVDDQSNLVDGLHRVLFLSLTGGFVGVAWIAKTIWDSLTKCPEAKERLFLGKAASTPNAATSA